VRNDRAKLNRSISIAIDLKSAIRAAFDIALGHSTIGIEELWRVEEYVHNLTRSGTWIATREIATLK